jgi:hypothetical protein
MDVCHACLAPPGDSHWHAHEPSPHISRVSPLEEILHSPLTLCWQTRFHYQQCASTCITTHIDTGPGIQSAIAPRLAHHHINLSALTSCSFHPVSHHLLLLTLAPALHPKTTACRRTPISPEPLTRCLDQAKHPNVARTRCVGILNSQLSPFLGCPACTGDL